MIQFNKKGVISVKREYPIAAIVCIVMGALALFTRLILKPVFDFVAYMTCICLFGETVANLYPLYSYVIPIAISVFMVVIPSAFIFFRDFGSNKVYIISKKICKIIATVYISSIFFVLLLCLCMQPFGLAWMWCSNNGEIPFAMLLFLVPVFFIFFWRIKLRLSAIVGNVANTVFFAGTAQITYLMCTGRDAEQMMFACFFAFIVLWFFEQALRDKEGKLKIFSRILLTALSIMPIVLISIETVLLVRLIITESFLWLRLNTLIFVIPVLAIFTAFTVKVNKKKNPILEEI